MLRLRELTGSRVGFKPTLLALCITGDAGSRWLAHPHMPSLPSVQDKQAQSTRVTNRAVLVGKGRQTGGTGPGRKIPLPVPTVMLATGTANGLMEGSFQACSHPSSSVLRPLPLHEEHLLLTSAPGGLHLAFLCRVLLPGVDSTHPTRLLTVAFEPGQAVFHQSTE